MEIPTWAIPIVGISTVLVALGVIWRMMIKPGMKLATQFERALPVISQMTETFYGDDNVFDVLKDIAAQFRTDGGSSLRDVVNRLDVRSLELEKQTETQAAESEQLKVGVEAKKQIDTQDREDFRQLMVKVSELDHKVNRIEDSGTRIETDQASVAEELLAAKAAVEAVAAELAARQKIVDDVARQLEKRHHKIDEAVSGVASDLAAQHRRADQTEANSPAGSASDRAAQSDKADK